MADKILIIDFLNYCFKGEVVFNDKTKQGYIVVYNFFRNLRALIEDFKPDKVFFALEGNDNFRKELFADYKAHRIIKTASIKTKEEHDWFFKQVNIILDLLKYLPVYCAKSDRYEADDVIATLADNLKDEIVLIISNDSDLLQLLQKNYKLVNIYDPFRKRYFSPPAFHYLTWKILAGDKRTDNVPGILPSKEAEKIASNIRLFTEFLAKEENRANYSLNKKLIELQIIDTNDLVITDYTVNFDELRKRFVDLQFKAFFEGDYWQRFQKTFKALH